MDRRGEVGGLEGETTSMPIGWLPHDGACVISCAVESSRLDETRDRYHRPEKTETVQLEFQAEYRKITVYKQRRESSARQKLPLLLPGRHNARFYLLSLSLSGLGLPHTS